jgi:hypothetical protein
MPLISLFFAVFILAGGIVAGFGVRNILNAHESRIWPHTDGTIVYSEVERSTGSKGDSSYSPGIKFQYSIQGQKYEGDIVAFGMKSVSAGRGFAERFVKKYPKGKDVKVFYNPSEVSKSVLEPGLSKRSFILFAFGISFMLIGICFATVAWLFT